MDHFAKQSLLHNGQSKEYVLMDDCCSEISHVDRALEMPDDEARGTFSGRQSCLRTPKKKGAKNKCLKKHGHELPVIQPQYTGRVRSKF